MGLFNFNKKKKFISKLSIDQRDEILITLILMKQMIDADGVEKPEEKEYYKKYLLNCGISSKEELESILDSAANLTSEQYDMVVEDFDEFQKLTVLQELFGVICSDDEIDDKEIVLLFQISRDMGVDDDIVIDMLGAREDLFKKKNEKSSISNKEVEINQGNNYTDKVSFNNATKKVDTEYIIGLFGLAIQMGESNDDKTESIIKIYTRIINEIPVLNGKSGGVVYTSENGILNITFDELESKKESLEFRYVLLEEIYFNRAQLYFKIGELEKAENDFQKAIDLNPERNDATFFHHLGVTKLELKRPIQDTLDCFDNSIKYNTKDDSFSLNLSDTYYMRSAVRLSNDDYLGAKKDIEMAFELNSDDKAIIKLKSEINDLVEENLKSKKDIPGAIEKLDKFCSDCGEGFKLNQKFCSNCGSKRKGIVEQVENDNLKSQLSKLVSYLEKITDSEKGDLYDYNYWLEQVVKRVDSHDTFYYNVNTSSLDDQKQLANSHYDEYHHRMIEENDDNKYKFITPRVECFLVIYKRISEISSISKEDKELYDRYYFHSKTSLYGAVKFLLKDTANGIEYLKEIFPEYDESMLDYDDSDSEAQKNIISKSTELLNNVIRGYFKNELLKNAELLIDEKNSAAYKVLNNLIKNSFPIDSNNKVGLEEVQKEMSKLNTESEEYLSRIIFSIHAFSKSQNWISYVNYILEISETLKIQNIEIETKDIQESDSLDNSEWEKQEITEEGYFLMAKKNNDGVKVHIKFFHSEKLERFDLENEMDLLHASMNLFIEVVNDLTDGKVPKGMENIPSANVIITSMSLFWKIYNSYDNYLNIPSAVFNTYAYLMYHCELYNDGIYFSKIAFEIDSSSSHMDTIGEGYYLIGNFTKAFSYFSNAIEYDEKNNSFDEEHILNYIKSAFEIKNLRSIQNGIDLLKANFKENNQIEIFEKKLKEISSVSQDFKCAECGYIPKKSQEFCVKCGAKFSKDNFKKDDEYKAAIMFLKDNNEELFNFVEKIHLKGKNGETISEDELKKISLDFVKNIIKTDKEFSKLIDDSESDILAYLGYNTVYIGAVLNVLSDLLNEHEADKFDRWDEIEQIYSIYLFIYDSINETFKI